MAPRQQNKANPPAGSRREKLAEQQALAEQRRRRNRILTAVFAVTLLVVGTVIAVPIIQSANTTPSSTSPAADLGITVREDSHRLSDVPDGRVTFVEFLDFECEGCGAAYPAIEDLRARYGDRVTFVVRYFPMPSHFNAERAARAVEAAARQGQFEPMYKKMFDTQTAWGEQQVPMDDLFRSYAQELGLDLARWDTDYNSPDTLARIKADIADGEKMGVTGTPTFFLNGEKFQPESVEQLSEALDQALAQ